MQGYKTLWLPGTDHASIATQTKVEKILKKEGSSRHKLGREKFLEQVNKFVQESHDTIINQCRKMGASLDWSREAYTLDATRNKAVNSVFKLMYDDGLIVRGERVINWCPRCHSTLADDEVEYEEKKSKLYYFKYSKDFPMLIATTRPETKLGDTAVAVNPKDSRYKDLIGKEIETDFLGIKLKIKIIADRHVDMDFGAGALGVTPAHSAVDWAMAEEHDLDIVKVIDEDGNIREGFNEFSGKTAKTAQKMIVEKLRSEGLMEKEEDLDNSLSVCYRCDTAIEPLPSLQWFIDVNKKVERLGDKSLKEISIEAVKTGVFGRDKIKIVPERFEKIYYNWMENLHDWCISRQIWFGHQVPVWHKDNEIYVDIEAPEGKGWTRDDATLDTWFSSGLWTFSTLANSPEQIQIKDGKLIIDTEDFKNFHPTQVMETGYDILFFWVARMIIMTTYAINDIPFQDVYLHGLVLDDKGKKMSKSKGNVIDPLDMIPKYGTDATRLSLVIGATPGNDMKLSEEKIAGFRNLVNKLWNISRFIITDNEELNSKSKIDKNNLSQSDKWILEKMQTLIKEVTRDIKEYRFSMAGEKLREFTWDDLADWYLEATKFDNSTEKNKILLLILSDLLKLWHPFIPFVTEVIWEQFGEKEQLIISAWPNTKHYKSLNTNKNDIDAFAIIKSVIESIRNARSENKVAPDRKVKAIVYARENIELIKQNKNLITGMRTGIKSLEIEKTGKKIENEIYINAEGIDIYLLGAIDKEKEAERIAKEIINLENIIRITEGKLSNKSFVGNAPEAIVKQEKEKLVKYKSELKSLQNK
jgi:valyl-tRNA synthetase